MRTIVLTGGGTAGHVTPHVALLPYLRRDFARIYYIGGTNPQERAIIEAQGVPFFELECVKFRRGFGVRSILRNLLIPFGYLRSAARARAILRELRPDVVFSKGGFVALPVVRAARGLGLAVVAHESDATMGLANRLSAGACRRICTTFEGAYRGEGAVCTGSPIRPQIYAGRAEVVAGRHGFGAGRNLLVVGGSQGAGRINAIVREARDELLRSYNIVHICGKGKVDAVSRAGYVALEYVDDIENYFAWADVVVSRAGSNAMCELMVLGKATLFIPLSTGRGDQLQNIKGVQAHNAAGVLNERGMTAAEFKTAVDDVYNRRDVYAQNARKVTKDGTKDIFNTIYGVVCEAYNTNLLRQSASCRQAVR